MARKCYKASMLGPCNFYWMEYSDLAQHLLPCLVVALLHLLNDPLAETKTKEWCLNFIDRLIKSFEIHELEVSTSTLYFNYLHQLSCCEVDDMTLFTKNWERVERAIPAELIADGGVLEPLRRCLVFLTTLGEACTCPMQMEGLRLFTRLHFVLGSLLTDEQRVSADFQVNNNKLIIIIC